MCNKKYLKKIIPFFLIVCFTFSLARAQGPGSKVWYQTTEADFKKGELDSVIVTNLEGGEVQLPHPLVKISGDSVDNTLLRSAVYDKHGNYLRLWLANGENLFAEKYSPDGSVLIESFQVNDSIFYNRSNTDYTGHFNDKDNGFAVVWSAKTKSDDFMNIQYYTYLQLYDSSGQRIGNNLIVNDSVMNQTSKPSVFFDDFENYRVFWSQGNWDKTSVFYQKYSGSGEKIGVNQLLNPENFFNHEYAPLVAKNSRGEFVVALTANVDHDPISNYLDAYVRHFDRNGAPKGPPIRVDDDEGQKEQRITDICYNLKDNLLVVWIDRREVVDGMFAQVYAQLYNADGVPLNRNRQIAPIDSFYTGGVADAEIVLLPGDQFQISWEAWRQGGPPSMQIVVNRWAIMPVQNGMFSSGMLDTGPDGADYSMLDWSEISGSDSTAIQFKMRSSSTAGSITAADWYGPSNTTDFYTIPGGHSTNPLHNGDRYIQYKAFLTAQIPGTTPILKDVSLWFTTLDSIAPITPSGLATQNDVHQIHLTWSANREPDLKSYKLYRRRPGQDYDPIKAVEIPHTETHYIDTNVVTGKDYFYAISSIDSNLNESPLSEDVVGYPFGRLLYVDDGAAGGGDGSYSRPYSTIRDGIAATVFGDTVIALPGNYAGTVDIPVGVALVGSGADVTKITGPRSIGRYVVNCGDSSMIKGFTVIKNTDLGAAIYCVETSPLITENVLINYSGDNATGIEYKRSSAPRILKNIISGFGYGISDVHTALTYPAAIILNNVIVDSKWLAIILNNPFSRIINNTIVQQSGTAISADCYYAGAIVMNNIIHIKNDPNGGGIVCGSEPVDCSYNNIIANRSYENCEPGDGSLSEEPVFRQEWPNDFRMASGSPGVDAGNPGSEFNDRDGTRNDMGAFGGPDPIEQNLLIENSTAVTVSSASGFPGDSITVSISLTDMAGMSRMQCEFTYDEELLMPISVERTDLTKNFQLEWYVTSGRVVLSLERGTEVLEGSGVIVTLQIVVDPASSAGEACSMDLENLQIHNSRNEAFRILQVTDGAFIVHLGSAGGRYVFVDQNNTGYGDGSPNAPFQTISGGITQASGGDTVLVAAGDYNEQLKMRGNFVKGMGALVTRVYFNEETVVFDGINQSGISGFTLEGGDGGWPAIKCDQSSPLIFKNKIIARGGRGTGIECYNSSEPEIFSNLIQGEGDGIWISCTASNPDIHDNTFRTDDIGFSAIECSHNSRPIIEHNIFYSAQFGLSLISSRDANPQITGNKFYYRAASGCIIDGQSSSDIGMYNNIFISNSTEPGSAIQLRSSQNVILVNNTFYINNGKAIQLSESSLLNMNNIFSGTDSDPFDLSNPLSVTYSAFWDFSATDQDTLPGIGNIFSDPHFMSVENNNFRLAPNSPCIDSGNPAPEYNDPDGSRNDMGAYGGPYADSSSTASEQTVLSITSTDAAPGYQAILLVESEFVAGVAEIKLAITYDQSILQVEDVKTTDLTKSFTLTTDFSSSDSVKITLTSPVVISTQNGPLVQVIFRVNDDAGIGNTTPVCIKTASLSSDVSDVLMIKEINDGHVSIIRDPLDISATSDAMPGEFQLSQNYPNPFNPKTIITYELPITNDVELSIYNLTGQKVATLVSEQQNAGTYQVEWDARDFGSGIYFCRLQIAEGFAQTKKMMVIK
ncbi:MAG: T9SS type A sorting domain-containing protein [Bacteroidetes bacterium]|nr:T9SS type A sorting domain-containing protein [Bacteroidota bacterium]